MNKIFQGMAGIFFLLTAPYASAESIATLVGKTNWGCVNFQTIGVCTRKTLPYVGIKVRYWQPVLLVETVKKSGDTVIDEFRPLAGEKLAGVARKAMCKITGWDTVSNTGSGGGDGNGYARMSEAHVGGFPLTDVFSSLVTAPCEGSPDLTGTFNYFSESDAVEWRMGKMESMHPMSLLTRKMAPICDQKLPIPVPGLCAGSWGPVYPRGGWSGHYSEAVASAITAYRAVDVASLNMIVPHVVASPVMFVPDLSWDKMQMVYPYATECLRIGESPAAWDQGRTSADGRYVWIYWRKKECCLF